jgi:hypothetical protein
MKYCFDLITVSFTSLRLVIPLTTVLLGYRSTIQATVCRSRSIGEPILFESFVQALAAAYDAAKRKFNGSVTYRTPLRKPKITIHYDQLCIVLKPPQSRMALTFSGSIKDCPRRAV